MSIVSYPVTPEVRAACMQFPRIGRKLVLQEGNRSPLEIVRLLNNMHFKHVKKLLKFIDRMLPQSGPIGDLLLKLNEPLQFSQSLAEIFLFGHLWDRLRDAVHPVTKGPTETAPDIKIHWKNLVALIEVYSPIDFMGFKLLERHVPSLFKYLDVSVGFNLHISFHPTDKSVKSAWYPYWLPAETDVRCWLSDLTVRAKCWLSKRDSSDRLCIRGPSDEFELCVEMRELIGDPADRVVTFTLGTRSTDTQLFFERGTSLDAARSPWGRKLKNKFLDRQAGPPNPSTWRIIVIDFAQSDAARPDFFCLPRIAVRLADTAKLLTTEIGAPPPYDILLPARLDLNPRFGKPVLINSLPHPVDEFVRDAGLDHSS